jgi:hypothetical protein
MTARRVRGEAAAVTARRWRRIGRRVNARTARRSCPWESAASEREADVQYLKAASVLVGVVMATGMASPAFAEGLGSHAPADGAEKTLVDANVLSKSTVTKPGDIVDIKAIVGSLDKVVAKVNVADAVTARVALGG